MIEFTFVKPNEKTRDSRDKDTDTNTNIWTVTHD